MKFDKSRLREGIAKIDVKRSRGSSGRSYDITIKYADGIKLMTLGYSEDHGERSEDTPENIGFSNLRFYAGKEGFEVTMRPDGTLKLSKKGLEGPCVQITH